MNSAVSRKYRLVSKMKTLMLLVYVVTKNFNYEFFKTNDSSRRLLNLNNLQLCLHLSKISIGQYDCSTSTMRLSPIRL